MIAMFGRSKTELSMIFDTCWLCVCPTLIPAKQSKCAMARPQKMARAVHQKGATMSGDLLMAAGKYINVYK